MSMISVQNVSKKFGSREILKDLSFDVEENEFVALVGPSGSGKSTIIKLLLGKLQSDQDKVLIDGNPLEIQDDINFSKEIGYVSQQTSIFSGSIRYNITLDDSYSDEEIWDILEKVCLADRVKDLPDGLDHNLSNMGEILSGGEKQRLVLARVLIRNYPILILDEATSALDEKTAVRIENKILADDKLTLIMISHHIQEEIKKQLTECVELKVQ